MSPRELAAEHLLLYASVPEESFMLASVLAPAGLVPARVSFIMLTEDDDRDVEGRARRRDSAAMVGRSGNRVRRRGRVVDYAAWRQARVGSRDAAPRHGHGAIVAHRFHQSDRCPRGTGETGRPPDGISMKFSHRSHANNAFVLMTAQRLP